MRGERMMQLDAVNAILDGAVDARFVAAVCGSGSNSDPPTPGGLAARYGLRPLLIRDVRVVINSLDGLVAATAAPGWQSYCSREPAYPLGMKPDRLAHPFAGVLFRPPNYELRLHFRGLADRRQAAVALAARLYAIDHDGRPPRRVDDLVPAYLPAIPADPLAAGAPMGLPYAVTTAPTTAPGAR